MIAFRIAVSALALALAATLSAPAIGAGFVDPLDAPATQSPLAARSLLQGVAKAGSRLVAVGQRGHVVYSTDSGASWKQASVPVSSDLTAVFFVDDKQGWAVGHDGVILHTADGGEKWALQLSGRTANDLLVAAMERKVAAEPASEDAKKLLAEAQRYKEQGADKPFLDVWFADAQNGYVVGAYNLIFRTRDGGKTWEPWFDRTDNPKFFNFYAIRPAAGELFIAGEGGLVLKLDGAAQRFRALDGPLQRQLFRRGRRWTCGRRLRPARQRLSQRRPRRDMEQGRRRTAGVGRRRNAHRGRRHTARRCRRPCRGHVRRRPHVRQGGAYARRCRSPESPMRAGASLRSSGRAASRSPTMTPR